jgi:ribonuclease E
LGVSKKGVTQVKGIMSVGVATYLQNKKRQELAHLETRYGIEIVLQSDPSLPPGAGSLEFLKEGGN